MLAEVRNRLLEILRKFLDEGKLEEAETIAYCYKCLADKEVEIHHIPVVVKSKEDIKEIEEKTMADYASALLGRKRNGI